MGHLESVLLSVLSASIMSLVGVGGAFALNDFLGLSLVVSLCVFMFIISLLYALSGVLDGKSSQKSFTRLRLEKNISDLFWEHAEAQARSDFFQKVGEDAPDSELKRNYQGLKMALHSLDKDK